MPHQALKTALIAVTLALGAFSAWVPTARAEKPVPAAPYYYVLDEPGVIDPRSLQALQKLLIEHDRLTGEQFLIAVFNSLDGEDLVQWTNKVFADWKIGKRGKDNGVLLALYWKDRKARIEVGYGLEPLLTDARSAEVLEEYLIPELKAGHPGRALALAANEILQTLESPLINSGEGQKILKSGGLLAQRSRGNALTPILALIVLMVAIGAIFLSLFGSELHYSSGGRVRSRGWRTGGWGGGGFGGFGGGGGFGGFGGGGGRSGGGGASGSW